jgi:hypothetical protein
MDFMRGYEMDPSRRAGNRSVEISQMTYLIQFWSPWSAQWIPWSMPAVTLPEAQAMLDERTADDPSLTRRIVLA